MASLEYLLSLIEQDPRAASGFDPRLVWKARALLALQRKEGEISARRRRLHWQMAMSPIHGMEPLERKISKERREYHRRIDELRDEFASMGWALED